MGLHGPMYRVPQVQAHPAAAQPARAPVAWIAPHQRQDAAAQVILLTPAQVLEPKV